jgi:hypothetical protein
VIAELEAEYQALKEARTGLGPHDRARRDTRLTPADVRRAPAAGI